MAASNTPSIEQSIHTAFSAFHDYMFRQAQGSESNQEAEIERGGALDDIHGSISSLYFLREELQQLQESSEPPTEEELRAAEREAFNAMQVVIDLAKQMFPEMFIDTSQPSIPGMPLEAHPGIPQELIEETITYDLYDRPVYHICRSSVKDATGKEDVKDAQGKVKTVDRKHIFNEGQLRTKPSPLAGEPPIKECPITRLAITEERYDLETQEAIYTYVLKKLAPPVETPAPAPVIDPTQPSAEPAPEHHYTHGADLGAPLDAIASLEERLIMGYASPEVQYGPANLVDAIYQPLYQNLPHGILYGVQPQDAFREACSEASFAIVMYAATEALSKPTGAPLDLGKILWEGHKYHVKCLTEGARYTFSYVTKMITGSGCMQHFNHMPRFPGTDWNEDATTNLIVRGAIPQENRLFYQNTLLHLVTCAEALENRNFAVVISRPNVNDVEKITNYLVQIAINEYNGLNISIFDPNGVDELPATMSSFTTIEEAALYLSNILPHQPNIIPTQPAYANSISLLPLITRSSPSLPLVGTSSGDQQTGASSSTPAILPLQQQSSSSSNEPMSSISSVQSSIMMLSDVTGALRYMLEDMNSDPSFPDATYRSYIGVQDLPSKEVMYAIYYEYYKLLTEELGWTPDGSFNWAEKCFLSENFAGGGLPSIPHMVYLRLKAIENAIKKFG